LIILFGLCLSGCGLDKPVRLRPESLYTIASPQLTSFGKPVATSSILLLSQVVASPGYQSSRMIYVQKCFQLNAFADHQWAAPPAQMLTIVLAQQLRDQHYFKAILTPPFSSLSDYRLDVQLILLQQEFLTPVSVVRLTAQVNLVKVRENRLIGSSYFQVTVPAPGNNPYSGVLAINKASVLVSKQISHFVIQSVKHHSSLYKEFSR